MHFIIVLFYLDEQCQKLRLRLTESSCEKRLQSCCATNGFDEAELICATTINGFGMIFDNTCTLNHIRCMYKEVCFLKRAPTHPHCRNGKYWVLTSKFSYVICSGVALLSGSVALCYNESSIDPVVVYYMHYYIKIVLNTDSPQFKVF